MSGEVGCLLTLCEATPEVAHPGRSLFDDGAGLSPWDHACVSRLARSEVNRAEVALSYLPQKATSMSSTCERAKSVPILVGAAKGAIGRRLLSLSLILSFTLLVVILFAFLF